MTYQNQFVDDVVLYNLDEVVAFSHCFIDDLEVARPQSGFGLQFVNCTLRLDVLDSLYLYIVGFENCNVLLEDNTTVYAHCLPYRTKDLSPYTTHVFTDSIKVGCKHFTKQDWAAMPLEAFNILDINGRKMAEEYREFLLNQCSRVALP